jgi:hypothetical protein
MIVQGVPKWFRAIVFFLGTLGMSQQDRSDSSDVEVLQAELSKQFLAGGRDTPVAVVASAMERDVAVSAEKFECESQHEDTEPDDAYGDMAIPGFDNQDVGGVATPETIDGSEGLAVEAIQTTWDPYEAPYEAPFCHGFDEEPLQTFEDAFVGLPVHISEMYLDKCRKMIAAVDSHDDVALASNLRMSWGTMTEERLEEHEVAISATVNDMDAMPKPKADSNAPPKLQKRMDDIRSTLATSKFPSRGTLGNWFRDELALKQDQVDLYASLGRSAAEEYRLKFIQNALEEYDKQFSYTENYSKVDLTEAQFLNFDQLVRDQGGWQSAKAVRGSLRCVNMCVCMGAPWVAKHPQTGRVLYALLSFKWVEKFEKCWEEKKTSIQTASASVSALASASVAQPSLAQPSLAQPSLAQPGPAQPNLEPITAELGDGAIAASDETPQISPKKKAKAQPKVGVPASTPTRAPKEESAKKEFQKLWNEAS